MAEAGALGLGVGLQGIAGIAGSALSFVGEQSQIKFEEEEAEEQKELADDEIRASLQSKEDGEQTAITKQTLADKLGATQTFTQGLIQSRGQDLASNYLLNGGTFQTLDPKITEEFGEKLFKKERDYNDF